MTDRAPASALRQVVSSGTFWMWTWTAVFALFLVWGILTVAFWMDSVRNLNALSLAAVLLAPAAGFQATLSMRKSDPQDDF